MRRGTGMLLGLVALGIAGHAQALPVEVVAPAECASSAGIEAQVEERLGASRPGFHWSARAHIEATRPGEWTLELRLILPEGETARVLQAGSCDELSRAVVAIVALAVADSAEREAPGTSQPEASAAAEPSPRPVRRADPPAPGTRAAPSRTALARSPLSTTTGDPLADVGTPAEERGGKWLASGGLGADTGTLAETAANLRLGFGRHWQRMKLRSAFGYTSANVVPQQEVDMREDLAAPTSPSSKATLWTTTTSVCVIPLRRGLRLAGCAGAEVGLYRWNVESETERKNGDDPWLAAVAGLEVGYAARRIHPAIVIEGGVPIAAPSMPELAREAAVVRLLAQLDIPL